MAINFPDSPSNGTQHTASGITWTWDGTTWKADGVTSSYSLPTASTTVLGGIKVGNNLSINSAGELSASGGEITVQEEGTSLSTAATTLNFVGGNVTATGTGATKTITITGGGGTPEITWTLGSSGNDYTFTGPGFSSATNDPTLYLIRGQTYKFDNQTGGHPFRIQSTGAQAGGGTAYNDGVTNQDAGNGVTLIFDVPMDAPDTLYYQCTAHPNMTGTINVITQGTLHSGLLNRSAITYTSNATFNTGDTKNFTMVAAKSYSLLKIKPGIPGWVTFYVTDAARTADASRTQGADPAPDAGVIAEVVTTSANQEVKMSPGVFGWHQDPGNDAVDTVFCKVTNRSGSTSTCTVSLTVVQLEA